MWIAARAMAGLAFSCGLLAVSGRPAFALKCMLVQVTKGDLERTRSAFKPVLEWSNLPFVGRSASIFPIGPRPSLSWTRTAGTRSYITTFEVEESFGAPLPSTISALVTVMLPWGAKEQSNEDADRKIEAIIPKGRAVFPLRKMESGSRKILDDTLSPALTDQLLAKGLHAVFATNLCPLPMGLSDESAEFSFLEAELRNTSVKGQPNAR